MIKYLTSDLQVRVKYTLNASTQTNIEFRRFLHSVAQSESGLIERFFILLGGASFIKTSDKIQCQGYLQLLCICLYGIPRKGRKGLVAAAQPAAQERPSKSTIYFALDSTSLCAFIMPVVGLV